MERIHERLSLFKELISCTYNLYLWEYDSEMNLLSSNCPDETTLHMVFSLENLAEYVKDYAKDHQMPLVFPMQLI